MNEVEKEHTPNRFRVAFSKSSINNLINTPNLYTTRARNEVKRMLNKPSSQSGKFSISSSSTQSIYSNDMNSYNSSIFSSNSNVSSQSNSYSNCILNSNHNPNNNDNNDNNYLAYNSYERNNNKTVYGNNIVYANSIPSNTFNSNKTNNNDILLKNLPMNNKITLPPLNFITEINLTDALPKDYCDMYSLETFQKNETLANGRPSFTQRELLDWEINDIRSLLIVDKLRPEWGNSIPIIKSSNNIQNVNGDSYQYDSNGNKVNFRVVLLPLNSTERTIINTLVSSDLYLESGLDYEFKYASAKYIVESMRKKYEMIPNRFVNNVLYLNKIDWRNIIENYLLNIAVEAECRFDFRQRCRDFKKWKLDNLRESPKQENGSVADGDVKIMLTKEEKSILWSQCQAQVYQRLGLDWRPDKV